jgi:hypothetical protein
MSVEDIREDFQNGTQIEWPDPQPLPSGLPAVPVLDERLLPESLRPWIADIAERAQTPLDFPAAGAIVALSAAVGRRLGIRPKRHDDWLVVPNLWGLIVGAPGMLKSPMLREIMKPFERLEAQAHAEFEREEREYQLRKEALQADRKRLINRFSRPRCESPRDELISGLRELEERRTLLDDDILSTTRPSKNLAKFSTRTPREFCSFEMR